MTQPPPLPNQRSFFRTAVVSEFNIFRRAGGFCFSIKRRGKEAVEHWLSYGEAAVLGQSLQDPEQFGPEVPSESRSEQT